MSMARPPTPINAVKNTMAGIVIDPPVLFTSRHDWGAAVGTNSPNFILVHPLSISARRRLLPRLRRHHHHHRPPNLLPVMFPRPSVVPPCRSCICFVELLRAER